MNITEFANPELFINPKISKNIDKNFFVKNYNSSYDAYHSQRLKNMTGGSIVKNVKNKFSKLMDNELFFNFIILLILIAILALFLFYRYKKKQKKMKKMKKFYSSGMYKKYQQKLLNKINKKQKNEKNMKIIDSLTKTKSLKAFNDVF